MVKLKEIIASVYIKNLRYANGEPSSNRYMMKYYNIRSTSKYIIDVINKHNDIVHILVENRGENAEHGYKLTRKISYEGETMNATLVVPSTCDHRNLVSNLNNIHQLINIENMLGLVYEPAPLSSLIDKPTKFVDYKLFRNNMKKDIGFACKKKVIKKAFRMYLLDENWEELIIAYFVNKGYAESSGIDGLDKALTAYAYMKGYFDLLIKMRVYDEGTLFSGV